MVSVRCQRHSGQGCRWRYRTVSRCNRRICTRRTTSDEPRPLAGQSWGNARCRYCLRSKRDKGSHCTNCRHHIDAVCQRARNRNNHGTARLPSINLEHCQGVIDDARGVQKRDSRDNSCGRALPQGIGLCHRSTWTRPAIHPTASTDIRPQ